MGAKCRRRHVFAVELAARCLTHEFACPFSFSFCCIKVKKQTKKDQQGQQETLAHNNNKSPLCILWLLIMFLSWCLCMFTVLYYILGLLRTNGGSLLFSWCLFISVEGLYFARLPLSTHSKA